MIIFSCPEYMPVCHTTLAIGVYAHRLGFLWEQGSHAQQRVGGSRDNTRQTYSSPLAPMRLASFPRSNIVIG
jgi:hypothetical protein